MGTDDSNRRDPLPGDTADRAPAANLLTIDPSTVATRRIAGMRPLARVADYNVLVTGAPSLFVDPVQSPTIEHFLLGFSGCGALCACIGADGEVLFGCDLYGLTEYFYRVQGNRLLVATRLSHLAAGDAELDEVSLFELFRTGTIYGCGTPIVGIEKSCPLSVLELRFAGETLRCTRRDLFPRDDAPGSFPEAIRGAAATLARSARQVQVNFSGGADSTAMLRAVRETGAAVTVAHYLLDEHELPTAYARLSGSGLRLDVVRPWRQLKCVDLGNRPCAIHTDPEFDLELADLARRQGSDLLLTGQNADAMAEFGNTRQVSIRDLVAGALLQGLCGSDARVPLARAIQKFHDQLPRWLLRVYAKGAALDQCSSDFDRAFLMAFACRRRPAPIWYAPDRLGFLDWELHQAWLERMGTEVQRVQDADGLTFRQRLFVIQFRNYLIGGDVRCITAAAARAGVRNAQLYTTPPLVRHFFNARPSMTDVFRPKGAIRRYGHWSKGPPIERERILSDTRRVRVQDAAYRLVGRHDALGAGKKLAELGAHFRWISRAALAALATEAGPSWRSRVSHIHALLRGDYEPTWFEDDGAVAP